MPYTEEIKEKKREEGLALFSHSILLEVAHHRSE